MSSSLSHAIPFFSSSFSSSSSSSSSSSDTKLFHSAHTCTSPWKKKKTKTKKEERSMRLVCARSSSSSTLYDLLEIPPHVGLSDIKQAYRQLALRYHPDVCSSHLTEESTRRFIEIQEAYETLSDPRRRAIYDHATSMGRATGGRIYKEAQPSDWRSHWEIQLSELKLRSSMKERRNDSWASRMRQKNACQES